MLAGLDLATTTQHQMITRTCAERTEYDFRCSICCSLIDQFGFSICALRVTVVVFGTRTTGFAEYTTEHVAGREHIKDLRLYLFIK